MKKLLAIFFTLFLAACAPVATPLSPVAPTIAQPTNPPTAIAQPTNSPTAIAQPTNSPTAIAQPTNSPTRQPTTPPTATPSLVTLRLWHAQPYAHHATLSALVAQFNAAHPTIRIGEMHHGDSIALTHKTHDAFSVGVPPNLIFAYPDDLAKLVQQNMLVPLVDLPANDIFAAFIDRYPPAGNQAYGIAPARALHVMYYNADLLKLIGAPRPPETWDEFARICDALAKIPDTTCYAMTPSAATLTTWVWNRGGEVTSADGKTSTLAQKPGADALNLLSDLFKKKQATLASKPFQEPTDFALGKIAFTFDATSGLAVYDRAIKSASKPFAWGIAPSPRTTREPVILAFGPALAIVKTDAAHERAARVFVNWMLDRAASSEWAKTTGMLPARPSAQPMLTEYARTNTQYGVALGWLKYARAEPNLAAWSVLRVHLADAMLAVAIGKPANDVLNDTVKKFNDAPTGR